jgi:hypothetical protein
MVHVYVQVYVPFMVLEYTRLRLDGGPVLKHRHVSMCTLPGTGTILVWYQSGMVIVPWYLIDHYWQYSRIHLMHASMDGTYTCTYVRTRVRTMVRVRVRVPLWDSVPLYYATMVPGTLVPWYCNTCSTYHLVHHLKNDLKYRHSGALRCNGETVGTIVEYHGTRTC